MLPTLEWERFLVDPAVRSAHERLRSLTGRQILLHPLSLAPKAHAPFRYATRESEHYFIDEASPTVCHSIVHELLHGTLLEEGYDYLTGRFDDLVHPILSNDLQHPEVFRRMETYGLPMDPYWERWRSELCRGLRGMRERSDQPHLRYANFPRVFSWFWFPDASTVCLAERMGECRGLDPTLYESARATYEATRGIGFATVGANRECLRVVRDHWLRYCTANPPDNLSGPRIVEAVARSRIVPARELIYDRSDERIYHALGGYGVRRPEGSE